MRGKAPPGRVLPEGRYSIALRAEARVVEGDVNDLLWDMNVFRYALQKVVDALWEFDMLPSPGQVHQMFYKLLRENYGFRAHVAKQIYKYALAMVRASRSNGGRKPRVRRLSVRLDRYDANIDFDTWTLRVNIRGRWYVLKLLHNPRYLEKFRHRKWYEIVVKYENGRLYVSIPFEYRYRPYRPRGVLAIDTNLRDLAVYDGEEIRYIATRFPQALGLKRYAERVQRLHPRTWRRSRRLLRRIRRYHRRSRNIVLASVRKLTLRIVREAGRRGYAVALEDLDKLWHTRSNSGSRPAWLLSRLAYRKLHQAIITKALERNVPVITVNPRNTSRTCPVCDSPLTGNGRTVVCTRCGFKADRDYAAAMDIHMKALQLLTEMRGAGVPLTAPRHDG